MTFIYERDPETHLCENELPTLYVKAFESYRLIVRQTDVLEIIYHANPWVVIYMYMNQFQGAIQYGGRCQTLVWIVISASENYWPVVQ